ncbi:MAG: hypothetical protein SNJ57_13155 [Cyanobacteriota bacterium]
MPKINTYRLEAIVLRSMAAGQIKLPSIQGAARLSGTVEHALPEITDRSIWTNLDFAVSSATSHPFTDVFKTSGTWIHNLKSGGWNNGGPLDLDENGYVRSLASTNKATLGIFNSVSTYPQGDYILLWEGDGTFAVDLGSATQVSNQPGRMVVRTIAGRTNVWISLMSVNPANYPRNIRMIMPGMEATYQTQRFNPAYLDRIAPFAGFRFMDWGMTNKVQTSSWSARRTPAYYNQAAYPEQLGGVCWEEMIALMNATGKAGWVCIPHRADNNYVASMAALFRDTLDPEIKLYLEYSNECWNNLFPQAHYCAEQADLLGVPGSSSFTRQIRFYGQRAVECFNIWKDVYGPMALANRVVRVFGAQAANTFTATTPLSWQDGHQNVDAVAIAPYIDPSFYARTTNAAAIAAMTPDQILNDFVNEIRTVVRTRIRNHKVALGPYPGKKLLTYELNTHLVSEKMPADLKETILDLYRQVHRSPRMRNIYREFLELIGIETGSYPNQFTFAFPMGHPGLWGALEYQEQPNAEAPRFQALLDYRDNAPWTPEP